MATGLLTLVWGVFLFSDLDPLLTYLRVDPIGDILWWQFAPELGADGVAVLGIGLIGFSVLLIVGAWTRVSAWAVFLLTLVLQRYNPAAFNGGDFILRGVLQLGVALGPAGACWSIDAVRSPHRARYVTEAWPLRFIQLHVSIGYVLTAYLKLRTNSWVDGTALWYALNLEELTRFDLPDWIAEPPLGAILTWGTWMTELFVGLGVWWRRSRPYALLAGVALHLGIALALEITFFSAIMIATYLAFLPGRRVREVFARIAVRFRARAMRPVPSDA
jgi:hypothetical protein